MFVSMSVKDVKEKNKEKNTEKIKENVREKKLKEKNRTVKVLAWASFLNDMGADMIYAVWPLFVTVFLGASMSVLGFIDGLGDAIVSLSQAASGYISDRIRKRKVFIWLGYFFGSMSRIGYAFSKTWHVLIPFKVLDRGGKIRDAPRDAVVADISEKKNRGRHFGIMRMMDNLGSLCGTTAAILFFGFLGYKRLFLIAAIPSLIGVLLILLIIKEKKSERIKIRGGVSFRDLDRNFKLMLLLSAFFALGAFSYSFLMIYAKDAGFKILFVPVLYLTFTAFAFMFSIPFGRLSDKIGRKPVLAISYVLWAMVCLSFIFFKSYIAILLIFVLYGLHKASWEMVRRTFVSELAPKKYRGTGLGAFQMVIGICALPSSFIAGILWDKVGKFVPLYLSLALTAVALILLTFVKEK